MHHVSSSSSLYQQSIIKTLPTEHHQASYNRAASSLACTTEQHQASHLQQSIIKPLPTEHEHYKPLPTEHEHFQASTNRALSSPSEYLKWVILTIYIQHFITS
jgi:hypothetical protein